MLRHGLLAFLIATAPAIAESLWIEAEHLDGIRGHCWPMGKPEMKKTEGHWALSGPGWAAEWNQGGESGFLSIAAGADDDKTVATKSIEIPAAGDYLVWARYGDWREKAERFQVHIEQEGTAPWLGKYGEQAIIEEDNEAKLYWGWAFAWDKRQATLKKGPAKLSLMTTARDPEPRQVDVIVRTTDATYRPLIKERPKSHAWGILPGYRSKGIPADLVPLARRKPDFTLPSREWRLRTFRDNGFLYLWNVSLTDAAATWLGDKPDRVGFPYNINDKETRDEFEKKYGGRDDVPIFSNPRIVLTFHAVGGGVFAEDPKTGEVNKAGQLFAKWLDEHPGRPWATMMNYHGLLPNRAGEREADNGDKRGLCAGRFRGHS